MRQLLERVGKTNRMSSGAGADGQYWRQVPKVNVLSRERPGSSNSPFIRVLLIILLLAIVVAIWTQNQKIGGAEEVIEVSQAEATIVQAQLAALQAEVDPIKTQIQNLNNQRVGAGDEFQVVTAGLIDWNDALSSILNIQADGVTFSSLTALPTGEVELMGQAVNSSTISQLPAEFNSVSNILQFQGIRWDINDVPPTFTASFKVR